MNISQALYKAARLSRDLNALSSGDPKRIARRVKNKAVGRTLARSGFWRQLWK